MLTVRGKDAHEYVCLSTDDKPVNVTNGSMCLEIDTGKIFAFDAQNQAWIEIA